MSNSFVAGQRLAASRIPCQRIWTVTSTTATAAVTAETVVITAPSSTYLAGAAYSIKFHGLMRGGTAGALATTALRDTNVAGTLRMIGRGIAMPAVSTNYGWYWEHTVANTTASDITSRILCITLTGTGGTAQINAGAGGPYWLAAEYIGLQTDFPEAVAL
jgi:hypothetical protein